MKVMTVIGTRPEGIKMAPLLKRLADDSVLQSVFVNTGQHAELLDQVLDLFDITADYNLKLMKANQSLEELSSRMIKELSSIMTEEKPDIVLVHGDTTTTFVACYVAFLQQIPVGHVEAGLRTYNLQSPFPEEANRQLTTKLATLHFAATEENRANLLKEQINDNAIYVVGNTVIDALKDIIKEPYTFKEPLLTLLENNHKTILLTTHRRENLVQLKGIYDGIVELLELHKDVQVIFPVHKNPKVREQAQQLLGNHPRVHLLEPLNYIEFANLLNQCHFIITDSGGIQEEAPSLNKPVLVARDTTERMEGVVAGTLKLIGTSQESLVTEGKKLLEDPLYYETFACAKNPYGEGKTSQHIIEILRSKQF